MAFKIIYKQFCALIRQKHVYWIKTQGVDDYLQGIQVYWEHPAGCYVALDKQSKVTILTCDYHEQTDVWNICSS